MLEDDTEAVFQGQAEIDEIGARAGTSNRRDSGDSTGENDVVAARGAIDSHLQKPATEEDPLLPRSNDVRHSHISVDDGNRRGSTTYEGTKDFDHLPWYKRPSIYWMLAPFSLMTLAFGGIIAPRLNLFLNLICREYMSEQRALDPGFTFAPIIYDGRDNDQCRIPEVQSRVARFTLYGNLIAGLLSAITSPKLGALSDRYGRKKVIMITSCGTIAGEILTICAASNPETFKVNWILIGFALDGLCGSFIVAMAISNAYATDCTPPALRNVAFGYFHACLFTGVAIGPILAGLIVKATGWTLSMFYVALGIHVFFIFFIGCIVPESLSKRRQHVARRKHAEEKSAAGPSADWINQLRAINLFQPLQILWPRGEGSSRALRRNLVALAAVDTMMFGVQMGSMTVIIIYANYQFGWGTFESSMFMSVTNSCRVICLVLLLPLVTRLVRGRNSHLRAKNSGSDSFDLSVIRTAVFFDCLGYIGYTLARTGPTMIMSGALASVGGIGSPTLQAALTKHVPADRTGQLLGATGLLHALARVVAPTVFNAIYAATVGQFTQTVFVCLTATFAVAFVVSWGVRPHVYLDEPGSGPPQRGDEGDREVGEAVGT